MQRFGPQIGIRALREAHALKLDALAERIKEQFDIDVSPNYLRNIEGGHKRGSRELMAAWTRCLGVSPLDVRQADELREALADCNCQPAA